MGGLDTRSRNIAGAILLFVAIVAPAATVSAQEAQPPPPRPVDADSLDGSRRPEPVLRAFNQQKPDTNVVRGPGFSQVTAGGSGVELTPMKAPFPELVHGFGIQQGAFLYDFSTPGWGHGLSLFDASPTEIGLQYSGVYLDDLFFNKARFDFVPITSIDSVSVRAIDTGRPQAYELTSRPYDGPRPLTEALYWNSNVGLQAVTVTHSQVRKRKLGGRDGTIGLVAGYHGGASNGEFPSSRLTRGRQMLARLRFEQDRWSIELMDLYNRGAVGQHGGVNPPIFRRLEASVMNNGAKRQTRRNDLSARLRVRAFGDKPLAADLFYARQTDVFIDPSRIVDTLSTKTQRLGLTVNQPVGIGPVTTTLFATTWSDRIRNTSWADDSSLASIGFLNAGARLHVAGTFDVLTEVSYLSAGSNSGVVLQSTVSKQFGETTLFATGGVTPTRESLFERNGYADVLDSSTSGSGAAGNGTGTNASGRTANARIGVDVRTGIARFAVTAFADFGLSTELLLASSGSGDSLAWIQPGATTSFGYTGTIALRASSTRGFYVSVTPTFIPWGTSSNTSQLRQTQSRPELLIRGTMGARYTLFEGDLVANAYVRGTYWSAFAGRTLHLPTGLLVLPADEALSVPSSSMVDFVLEAGVRTATIYVAFENVLSGTTIVEGNVLVPGYPLARQRFRLGVHWPIFD